MELLCVAEHSNAYLKELSLALDQNVTLPVDSSQLELLHWKIEEVFRQKYQ